MMKYSFKDTEEDFWFEFHHNLPENKGQYKHSALNKINISALTLFGMYRKTIYDSYGANPDLAQDIKTFNQNLSQRENGRIIDKDNSLNNYSIYVSLLGIKKLLGQASCYIAYNRNDQNWPEKIGFVSFYKDRIDGREVVYISDLGVKMRGTGIARRLMECVLTHYPVGTEFYILTRKFNTPAIYLYQNKLGFKGISLTKMGQSDYDERYVGFKHLTTQDELDIMHDKKINLSSSTVNRKSLSLKK